MSTRIPSARVGGRDEGGGFDIGPQGLRAAVRAVDGRGPRTSLDQGLEGLELAAGSMAGQWAGFLPG